MRLSSFNPRPARRPSATPREQQRFHPLVVSILARPGGRALRPAAAAARAGASSFNPRPARRPSATWPGGWSDWPPYRGFNPRPARRPSATVAGGPERAVDRGFQSSPGPEAEHTQAAGMLADDIVVSILARPGGRGATRTLRAWPASSCCFNPRPARRPSATAGAPRLWAVVTVFQSSPGPEAERYALAGRSQAEVAAGFNPRPARRPSATAYLLRGWAWEMWFQSSPGPEAERYVGGEGVEGVSIGFNPRPARRPSATRPFHGAHAAAIGFQSSPGPEAEALRREIPAGSSAERVSILARPGGRALLDYVLHPSGLLQFQSSPGPEAERYVLNELRSGLSQTVSILARPGGRALRIH